MRLKIPVGLVVFLLLSIFVLHNSVQAPTTFLAAEQGQSESLVVVTPDGEHIFWVETAVTLAQRQQGLMNRTRLLAKNEGMLFRFDAFERVSLWMKNTHFALDILFVDKSGRIVTIVTEAAPLKLDTISSEVPVLAALEVRSGTVNALGLTVGDRILHRYFQRQE